MKLIGGTVATPWKPMSMIVDVEGANGVTVKAAAFESLSRLIAKADISKSQVHKDDTLDGLHRVIQDYVDGKTNAFDELLVEQPGGEYMQSCWNALRTVPAGKVVTYGQLASLAGRPQAIRAAGTACATNLIAPVIPCHRVVRAGGHIGNYGFGVPIKRALLLHEGIDI
jgi:methylated-DNA-[protein]-cysteine S-methyltransferase